MNITLRQLRYLVAVARYGQISRAAEALNVSQPALSVQVRELERALDLALFERKPRQVILTPAGHEILEHAERVLAAVDGLERTARMSRGLGGRLSLGVIPTVATYLIPTALPSMRMENVALDLRVRETTTARLLSELVEGRLDAAVIALPSGVAGLEERHLFTDRFLLAGASSLLETLVAEGRAPEPTELKPRQLLLLDEGHCLADQALEACSLDRRRARIDLGASSLSTLSGLVASGFGLTFMPEIAAAREVSATPGLHLVRFPEPQPSRRIGLVCRDDARGQGWFDSLADLLCKAGTELVARADSVVASGSTRS